MLGITHILEACGTMPAGDTAAVKTLARTLAKHGYTPLFINGNSKTPAETRSDTELKRLTKEAQAEAKAAGRDNWEKAKPRGGGVHLAIKEAKDVTSAYKNALKRQSCNFLNIGLALNGRKVIVVDCDTEASVNLFYSMLHEWGITDVYHPTVATPGVQTDDGDWKHSNGGHFYFKVPENVDLTATSSFNVGSDDELISFMVTRKYVLIPPSKRPEGTYRFLGGVHAMTPDMVDFVLTRGKRQDHSDADEETTPVVAVVRTTNNSGTDTPDVQFVGEDGEYDEPINVWAQAVSWNQLLTGAGWTNTGKVDDSCGCGGEVYTAPGEHGSYRSATAHEDGCSVNSGDAGGNLRIWTDNPPTYITDFAEARGMDISNLNFTKLNFTAAAYFDGDVSAAMKNLGIDALDKATADTVLPTIPGVKAAPVPAPATAMYAAPAPATRPQLTVVHGGQYEATADEPTVDIPDGYIRQPLDSTEVRDFKRGANQTHLDGDRTHAILHHEDKRYILLDDYEFGIFNSMLETIEPHVSEITDEDRFTVAGSIRLGSDATDKSRFPKGTPYDPVLIEEVFGYNDVTKAIFNEATRAHNGRHAPVSPIGRLLIEMIRLANRVPVGLKTWTGNPLALYLVIVGQSGKGKSLTMSNHLSPWPDTDNYPLMSVAGADGESGSGTVEQNRDRTIGVRSGIAIPEKFVEERVVDYDTGDVDEDGQPVIDARKDKVVKDFPSEIIEKDEMSGLLAIGKSDTSTIIEMLDEAYTGRPIGGDRANGDTNRVDGDYRLQIICGMQGSKFGDILEYIDDGFPQRLFMSLVTWPWSGFNWKFAADAKPMLPPHDTVPAIGTVDGAASLKNEEDRIGRFNGGSDMPMSEENAIITHSVSTQQRIACLGAIMFGEKRNGRFFVSEELYAWAGSVMECSYRTYKWAEYMVSEAGRKSARAKGTARALERQAETKEIERLDNEEKELLASVKEAIAKASLGVEPDKYGIRWVKKTPIRKSFGGSRNRQNDMSKILDDVAASGNKYGIASRRGGKNSVEYMVMSVPSIGAIGSVPTV